jgi:5-oxoprolinase (ATP-hydrolysing)
MANAIKKISIRRGHDISDYVLCCFGGAAGQHACLVADALGLKTVLVHPLASVLSAIEATLAMR